MVTCLLCNRPFPREDCHIIVPTEEEQKALQEQGNPALEEYPYCEPCWKTLSDPRTGPAVLKGLFEHRLRQAGVANAEEIAEKYHAKLVAWAMKPRS